MEQPTDNWRSRPAAIRTSTQVLSSAAQRADIGELAYACTAMTFVRSATTLIAALALALASGLPRMVQAQPPIAPPDTATCPDRIMPPPAIDASEAPMPGQTVPTLLPVPDMPAGGPALGQCGLIVAGQAPPVPRDISATGWVVADPDTGKVLAARDPHGRYRPASTIKVLLSIVALHQLNLATTVTGTRADADADGTRVGIGPGGRYTNLQLMQALLMCSGNDAAHAIAMQLGGMAATVAEMNAEAHLLGATDTRAATPSGLDGPGMSTSAYDMALFFRRALGTPHFAEIIHTERAMFPGYPAGTVPGVTRHPDFPISNDNQLLYNYAGAIGSKNGYTDDARQTLVGAAARGRHRIEVVLMHADVRPIRPWEQMARLLDYGFALEDSDAVPVGELVTPTVPAPPAPPAPRPAALIPPHADPYPPAHRWRVIIGVGGVAIVVTLLYAAARSVRRRRR